LQRIVLLWISLFFFNPLFKVMSSIYAIPPNRILNQKNTIGYNGMTRVGRRFVAQICVNKKNIFLGTYDTLEEGAVAYDQAVVKYDLPRHKLNWPDGYPEEILKNRKRKLRLTNTTGYNGVKKTGKRFQADLRINKKATYLGVYDTIEEAAVAYDQAVIKHDLPRHKLNYPNGCPKITVKRELLNNNATGYRGVSKKGERFQASIGINKKQTYLGTFDTPKEAAVAYDRAIIENNLPKKKLNFPNKNNAKNKKITELNHSDQKKGSRRSGSL
jgi:hypothetical protein